MTGRGSEMMVGTADPPEGAGQSRAAGSGWRMISAGAALLSCAAAARAEPVSSHVFLAADQFMTMCDMSGYSPDNPSPAAMLYLMGVVDSEALAPARSRDPLFCVPDGTGQAALARIVCRYVQDRPNIGSFTAASLTYAALRSSFPCR